MSDYLTFVANLALGVLSVAFTTFIARFVISHWLEGRSLAIAALASGAAYAIGRYSFSGPAGADMLDALGHVCGAVLALVALGTIWLRQPDEEDAR